MSKKELTLDDLLKDERMKNVTEYAKLLGSILTSIDDHGFQEHWIHESNLPYLSSSPTREELIRSASGWAARIPECPVDSTRQRREEASA